MPCINVREGDGLVSIIKLDQCGTPVPGAGNLLRLTTISEFGFEDTVEEGDSVTERNFGGRKFYSDAGQDEISDIAVNLTTGGINPAIDTLLTGSTLKAESKGFGRRDLAANVNVAIQVLMRLDTDACTTSGEAPIAGWLFPLVKNWRPAAATTLNGTDLVKPQYSGKGYKNANLFDTVVSPLTHWQNIIDEANEWYAFYIFDAEDVSMPTSSQLNALTCNPEALVAAGS